MYGCESWTIKKAECQRIDAFELQCWRRLLSPLDCKEIKLVKLKRNQPWILTGRTDVEAEAPILWLTWCELLTHWKRPWCWERLKAEEEGNRGWDGCMASPIQWTWIWANFQEMVKDREAWCAAVRGLQIRTRLGNCTTDQLGPITRSVNFALLCLSYYKLLMFFIFCSFLHEHIPKNMQRAPWRTLS